MLGLDKLAIEKRAAAASEREREESRKRPRLDAGDEPHFKGMHEFVSWVESLFMLHSPKPSGFTHGALPSEGRGNTVASWRPVRGRSPEARRTQTGEGEAER